MESILIEKFGDWENIAWVLKAVSKEVGRYNLNCLKVERGFFIGTDGHRLHLWDSKDSDLTADVPEGLYEIAANPRNKKDPIVLKTVTDARAYPDVKSAFPTGCTKILEVTGDTRGVAYSQLARAIDPGYCLQWAYVLDMIDEDRFTMFYNEPRSGIQFQAGNRYGLIMALQIPE